MPIVAAQINRHKQIHLHGTFNEFRFAKLPFTKYLWRYCTRSMKVAHTVLCAMFATSLAFDPTPCPAKPYRYPVGYDPDNRKRPVTLHAPPVLRKTANETRRAVKWKPPVGYRPRTRLPRTPDTNDTIETVPWALPNVTENKPHTIDICSGMWMGDKILYKQCITMPVDQQTTT